jgi:uncharacterized membrane protein YgcG
MAEQESNGNRKLTSKWTFYCHDGSQDWTIKGFYLITTISTIEEFWSAINYIIETKNKTFECGMFFFMKEGHRPLWEVPENKNGGTWSKRLDTSKASDAIIDLAVHCISDELLTKDKDTLVGFSTSPKGDHMIIKIWNSSSSIIDKNIINPNLTFFELTDDVVYTANGVRPVGNTSHRGGYRGGGGGGHRGGGGGYRGGYRGGGGGGADSNEGWQSASRRKGY